MIEPSIAIAAAALLFACGIYIGYRVRGTMEAARYRALEDELYALRYAYEQQSRMQSCTVRPNGPAP